MPPMLPTPTPLKLRLYVMMFLQYFVQGCFLPIITVYLEEALGFRPRELGHFNALIAIGPLLAAFLVGQVVDRHFQTQHVLAVTHLAAGAVMIGIYNQQTYWPVIVLGTIYSVLYTPTMMLTNALTFHHLKDREREFPLIRLWGTIGFIVPAWIIEFFVLPGRSAAEATNVRGIALLFAGVAGLVMGLFCLTLPKTQPQREQSGRFAPGAVLRLLTLRNFLVLVLVTLGIALVHKFFFFWNGPFIKAMLLRGGVENFWVARVSSLGQIAEIGVMVLLVWFVARLGFKWTMICGVVAYMLRCLIFAAAAAGTDAPFSVAITMVCLGQMLHGFCFACFMAAAFMYVDRQSPSDARGSMQTFYGTFIIGLGFFIGGFVGGEVGNVFTTELGQPTWRQQSGIETTAGVYAFEQPNESGQPQHFERDWPGIWLSSAAIALVCLLAFAALFPPTAQDEGQSDRQTVE